MSGSSVASRSGLVTEAQRAAVHILGQQPAAHKPAASDRRRYAHRSGATPPPPAYLSGGPRTRSEVVVRGQPTGGIEPELLLENKLGRRERALDERLDA